MRQHNTFQDRCLMILLLLFACMLSGGVVHAQDTEFEEIVIGFEVQRLLETDVFVRYDGETVYLPLVQTFELLEFHIDANFSEKKITGFVIDQDDDFQIDLRSFKAETERGTFHLLPSEYHLAPGELYLKVDLFQRLFGLDMQFDFSLLRVYMPLDKDLPAYQRLERESKRRKLLQTKQQARDVRELPFHRNYLGGAALDWTLGANPLEKDGQYYNLNFGAIALGGDLRIDAAGNSENRFDSDQFRYRWHYYIKDKPWLTQVELGHVFTGGTLGRRFTGGMVTNKPQVRRKYFQTIDVSGFIGQNWEVELYVDNRLIDYQKTDASGQYQFTVDLFYGASVIELEMYGPNGEIQTEERYVNIPHNLIPKNTAEYEVAVGESEVQDSTGLYAQASAYYGVLNRLTVGAITDVPINDTAQTPVHAGEVIFQPLTNLTATAAYSPSYLASGSFNFNKPGLLSANGSFTKYFENDLRNPLRQEYRAQLAFSMPFRIGGQYFGTRYYASLDKFPGNRTVNMNFGGTASVGPIHMNYIGRMKLSKFVNRSTKSMASQLLLSPRLIRFFTPQFRFDYNHDESRFDKYGVYLNKRVFRTGQITLSYERNVVSKSNTIMLTFNFFSDFAHFTTRALHAGGELSMNQLQRGSIRYDQNSNRVMFDRRASVGYASAVVRPYLDENYNGRRDTEEEYLPGLRANVSGVSGKPRGEDRQYYYDRLRAYDEYTVQIDPYSLDDPLLKPTNENYKVTVNPNMVTSIEVPLVIAGEMTGQVKRRTDYGETGIGGIRIIVVNLSKDIMSEVTTFSEGDFYYLGLLPGKYRAYIDPTQIANAGYVSIPESIEFDIEADKDGLGVSDINFLLVPQE